MKRVIKSSAGDINLFKFLVIPCEDIGDFRGYFYDDFLQSYVDLWEYTYNKITKETDDRLQSHADHIDALPFELRKIYRQVGYWGRTDWFQNHIRFFVNAEVDEDVEEYLKRLCR